MGIKSNLAALAAVGLLIVSTGCATFSVGGGEFDGHSYGGHYSVNNGAQHHHPARAYHAKIDGETMPFKKDIPISFGAAYVFATWQRQTHSLPSNEITFSCNRRYTHIVYGYSKVRFDVSKVFHLDKERLQGFVLTGVGLDYSSDRGTFDPLWVHGVGTEILLSRSEAEHIKKVTLNLEFLLMISDKRHYRILPYPSLGFRFYF